VTSPLPRGRRGGLLTLAVRDIDEHRWLTVLAMVGLGLAVGLALLGLPPVDLHGPLHRYGVMDPLCGGTRATRLTLRGDLAGALRYNPLGIVAVAGAVAVLARSVVGTATSRWVTVLVRKRRLAFALLVLATLALGIRQQLRADLLMSAATG
jgi:hypothetical protein